MRENSAPLESEHRGIEPDPTEGKSQPGDVDQLVFSFLTELDTLSDVLGLACDKPACGGDRTSLAADRADAVDGLAPAPKPVSYRNIDVLLMDNRQSHAGKERAREESPHPVQELFESQSLTRSEDAMRRRTRILICSAAAAVLLGLLGILFHFELSQSIRKDIAVPLQKKSRPSLASTGAPARAPDDALSPAEVIERVVPRYPAEARKSGVAGAVVFDADIDKQGNVVRAVAVSGPPMLRSAAKEALLKWRFKPARRAGVNLASTARVSVVFDRQNN